MQPVVTFDSSSAQTLHCLFIGLRACHPQLSAADALARVMPFQSDKESSASVILSTAMRVTAIAGAINEFAYAIPINRAVEPISGAKVVAQSRAFLQNVAGNSRQPMSIVASGISDELLSLLKVLDHLMPKDRLRITETRQQDLIVAMTALRSHCSDSTIAHEIKAELRKIIAMLEEAVVRSHLRGAAAIANVLIPWQVSARTLRELAAQSRGEGLDRISKAHATLAEKARPIIDDALRAAKAFELLEKLGSWTSRLLEG